MLRAVGAFIIVVCSACPAGAEEIVSPLGHTWSAAIAAPKKPVSKPAEAIPVQLQDDDPFCAYGVGPCGGTCNEENRKPWKCLAAELPCYKSGGRCKCEVTSMCQPKIR